MKEVIDRVLLLREKVRGLPVPTDVSYLLNEMTTILTNMRDFEDDDWVDCGYEVTAGGEKRHVWHKRKDIPVEMNRLREEAERGVGNGNK